MADIERLAMELAALPDRDREHVLQRMRQLGAQAQEVSRRLRDGHRWGDLVGSRLYDSFGNAVAIVHDIKMDLQSAPAEGLHHHRDDWLVPLVQRTRIEITAYGIEEGP